MKNLLASKKLMTSLSLIGLYLISSGASLAVFSYIKDSPSNVVINTDQLDDARSKIASLPKTEECPINGAMFSKVEKSIWEKRRPITAMIENHVDSRPQSGLSKADVVFEAVAEGGITRFLGIFYCGVAGGEVKIAPVRSARVYFINLAAGFGDRPIFMHVGGANDYSGSGDTTRDARALELLEKLEWRIPKGNDFDTTYDSGFPVFWRDYERLGRPVATEHTMVASIDKAYEQAAKRDFNFKDGEGNAWNNNFKPWLFSEDKPSSNPSATEISFEFWSNQPAYDVSWKYNKEKNSYFRENGGEKHIDQVTGAQLEAKNVLIVFAKETGPVDVNKHMLYKVTGSGDALIFQNGSVSEITWSKIDQSDMIRFEDSSGKDVSFVKGPIWIEIVPDGNNVEY